MEPLRSVPTLVHMQLRFADGEESAPFDGEAEEPAELIQLDLTKSVRQIEVCFHESLRYGLVTRTYRSITLYDYAGEVVGGSSNVVFESHCTECQTERIPWGLQIVGLKVQTLETDKDAFEREN